MKVPVPIYLSLSSSTLLLISPSPISPLFSPSPFSSLAVSRPSPLLLPFPCSPFFFHLQPAVHVGNIFFFPSLFSLFKLFVVIFSLFFTCIELSLTSKGLLLSLFFFSPTTTSFCSLISFFPLPPPLFFPLFLLSFRPLFVFPLLLPPHFFFPVPLLS